jgi:hypothetical protein
VKNGKYLIIFAASLYGFFFYMAVWSALPSSITGNTAALPGITERCVQFVDCELVTGTAECFTSPQIRSQSNSGQIAGSRHNSWIDTWQSPIYQCALMSGASYN